MATRLPPLLQPYLSPPPANSLVLLTSVLGASTNWLVLRWICSLLEGDRGDEVPELGASETGTASGPTVVLCSFLREGGFWREGAGRMVGLCFSFSSSLVFLISFFHAGVFALVLGACLGFALIVRMVLSRSHRVLVPVLLTTHTTGRSCWLFCHPGACFSFWACGVRGT